MKKMLTQRQREVLAQIERLEGLHGRNVTSGELARSLGITRQSLSEVLVALRQRGELAPTSSRYAPVQRVRHSELSDRGGPVVPRTWPASTLSSAKLPQAVPVLGCIAAGRPGAAEQQTDEWAGDLRELLGLHQEDFLLRVEGLSMCGAGIHPGDLVAVHVCAEVQDGEIAVVLLPEEQLATLKRLYRDGTQVRLESENPDFPPMHYPADQVQVQGRYAGHVALKRARRSRQG